MDTPTPGQETGQINPLDAQFTGSPLGTIYKPVNELSPRPTRENPFPPYTALLVSQDLTERKALLARLVEGWKLFTAAMPDPEKDPENFTRFVQDRCHGVLEMLRLLVTMQGKKTNPDGSKTPRGFSKDEVYQETMAMGVLGLPKSAVAPKSVNDLIGEERDEIMHSRVERVRTIIGVGPLEPLKARNRQLMAEVSRKFTGNETVTNIMESYTARMEELEPNLTAPEYTTAQLYSLLLNKLAGVHSRRPDLAAQLDRLAGALSSAKSPGAVSESIKTFGEPIN